MKKLIVALWCLLVPGILHAQVAQRLQDLANGREALVLVPQTGASTLTFNIDPGMTEHQLTYTAQGFTAITVTVQAGIAGGTLLTVGSASTTGGDTIKWSGTQSRGTVQFSGLTGSGTIYASYFGSSTVGSNASITPDRVQSYTFTDATPGPVLDLRGSRVSYHRLFIYPAPADIPSCTVFLEQSEDGTTWTGGSLIGNQSCIVASGAVTAFTNSTSANFVRINPLLKSGTGSVTVVYEGWSNLPGAGGVTQASTTSGQAIVLIGCAAKSSIPTYTNATTNAVWCTTSGGIPIDGSLLTASGPTAKASADSVVNATDQSPLPVKLSAADAYTDYTGTCSVVCTLSNSANTVVTSNTIYITAWKCHNYTSSSVTVSATDTSGTALTTTFTIPAFSDYWPFLPGASFKVVGVKMWASAASSVTCLGKAMQ